MIVLLLKASIVILVLLAFYKLVLEKESFFKANRAYLLGCLLLAGALPFVALPELIENQGALASWISPSIEKSNIENEITNFPKVDVDDSNADHAITGTTNDTKTTEEFAPINRTTVNQATVNEKGKGLMYWLTLIYLFGAGVLAINLFAQIIGTAFKVYKNTDKIEDEDCVIVNLTSKSEPCSFFKYIFINPTSYDYDTYEQIVEHEKIHVAQRHTWDLLVSEIAVILLWFNPFIWILRKEVEKNIEYQTDDILVNGRQEIKEGYQMNLVNIASYTKPLAITTNYNQSLIKQRIMKMNSKKSNNYNYWKYAFAAPILFATILILNEPQTAYAQADDTMAFNDSAILEVPDESPQTDPINKLDNRSTTIITTTTTEPIDVPNDEQHNSLKNLQQENQDELIQDEPVVDAEKIAGYPNPECQRLLEAIRNDDIQLVKTLIQSTDPNCIDHNPGYDDIISNGSRWRMEKAGVPLMAVGRTGNLEIAKLLIDAGAKVNYQDHSEGNAILTSADYGHLDLLKYFVAEGGKIEIKSANQGSAMIVAAGRGHLEIVKYLIKNGEKVNFYSPNQGNALIAAAQSGSIETVKYLIDQGAEVKFVAPNQGNALIAACQRNDLAVVKYLIEQGADIHRIAPNQGTALIAAASHGRLDMVEYLIDLGADVNQYSPNQGNALIVAANNGYLKTVEYLISKGANVDFISPNQGSALSVAAHNGHTDIANLLSGMVKNINAMSDGHGNALISAARNGHMGLVKSLLEKGAEINKMNDGQGFALNAAASNGINTMVEYLLDNGAEINLQNDGQGSALNAAARNNHDHTIQLLLEKGADVNLQNDGQGSALNAAARNGHISTVKLLIERGANVNLYSDGQGTALSAASKNGFEAIVDYLESKGAKHIYGRQ